MDNVTHSLAGLLFAESAVRLRAWRDDAEPPARFAAIAAVSSTIAANLPDADLLYTGIGADRLRYMLDHRGYTHTVVLAIFGAAIIWSGAVLFWRARAGSKPSVADLRWLLALLLVSTLSHLVLDWTNSYGVHPFWPVDDRWRYGDAVFIVEPWFWVVSVPTLVLARASRVARVVLSLVLLVGVALAWRVDFVSTGAALALTIGAIVFAGLARILSRDARAGTAVAGWIAVTMVMTVGSARSRAAASTAVHGADRDTQLLDVVVTPLPANPLCTSVITVERAGATYHTATARVSAVPELVDAARCGSRSTADAAHPASRRSTPAVHWDTEWSAPVADLASLARESCRALAAMRFIRVPIWRAVDDSTLVIGDVRFGGASGSSFSDVRVPRRSPLCPGAVPPWVPPRTDLLGAAAH